jgi:hypothetical protein
MPYTAIVLTENDGKLCAARARALGFQWERTHCHHVTLAMGAPEGFRIGQRRVLTVTHAGSIEGRVCAFRVSGAEDSRNAIPHVTIGASGEGRPKDSNRIENWEAIEPFQIGGTVEICE